MCTVAEQAGQRISHLRIDPASPIPSHQHDTEIARICADLKGSVTDELAAHYGCEELP
jgi:hypothetical protein